MPKGHQDSDNIEFRFLGPDESPPQSDGLVIMAEFAVFGACIHVNRGSERVSSVEIRGPVGHENLTTAQEGAKVRAKQFGAKVVYMKGFPDA